VVFYPPAKAAPPSVGEFIASRPPLPVGISPARGEIAHHRLLPVSELECWRKRRRERSPPSRGRCRQAEGGVSCGPFKRGGPPVQNKAIPAKRSRPHHHAPFPVWSLKGSPGRVVLPSGLANLWMCGSPHALSRLFVLAGAWGAFSSARRPGGTWLRDSARREHLCSQLP
jgi:hypothetical protein